MQVLKRCPLREQMMHPEMPDDPEVPAGKEEDDEVRV